MKKAAYGTQLRYVDPDDSALTRVHFVADISGPGINVETIDVTTHDSPDAFSEFVPGMADGADVSFDLIFDAGATGHKRLLELMDDRITMAWSLILPRPETQVLDSPLFENPGDWSDGGAWDVATGQASISVATAAPEDALTQSLTLLNVGEVYRLEIVFGAAGTGGLSVSFGSDVVGTFSPAGKAKQSIEFNPDAAAGDLTLTATGGPTSIVIKSLKLFGVSDPTRERFDFTGILTAVGVTAPVKDALKASVTIKISGEPNFTAALNPP